MSNTRFLTGVFILVLLVTLPAGAVILTDETETPTDLPTMAEPTTELPTIAEPTTELPTVAAPTTEATVVNPAPGGQTGYIWVYSNVDGSQVSFSPGSYSCTVSGGSCSVTVSVTGTPASTFTVTADGYDTYTGQVGRWPSSGDTVYYTATLIPSTTTPTPTSTQVSPGGDKGYLWFFCNVDGALVTLRPIGTTCTVSNGMCGMEVTVTGTPATSFIVTKSGYSDYTGTIDLWPSAGETYYYTAVLDPYTPTTGTLYVTTSPSSASISLNGAFRGYSPYTITDLTPGTYTVTAQRSGYNTASQSVTVYAGQISVPSLTLTQNTPSSTGTLAVTSTPSSAMVYIDGLYAGQSPVTSVVSTGTHSVTVQKTGYSYWSGTATVAPNGYQSVQATLNPAANGWITVKTTPAGAAIYLDNSYRGTTNSNGGLTINEVYPGLHEVKLLHPAIPAIRQRSAWMRRPGRMSRSQ